MADPVISGSTSPQPSSYTTAQRDTRRAERETRLESTGLTAVENPTAEQRAGLNQFYNTTLNNIQTVRNPGNLPSLEGVQARTEEYHRGSADEQRLKLELEKAKGTGNQDEIKKARENLQDYWMKIVDEEYGKASPQEIHSLVRETGSLYRSDSKDPMTAHKMKVLKERAGALNDRHSMADLEKIEAGFPTESSQTGSRLAKNAQKHAHGDGHSCYHYVADDLARIGIYLEGRKAYMASDQLAESDKVREIKNYPREKLSELPAGTIVVWDKCKGEKPYKNHPCGHISISMGDGREASDVMRRQQTNYGPRYRVFAPSDM